jgi:hypothetical protein
VEGGGGEWGGFGERGQGKAIIQRRRERGI